VLTNIGLIYAEALRRKSGWEVCQTDTALDEITVVLRQ